MNREQVRDFLDSKSVRELSGASWIQSFDNNQGSKGGWETAKLRVLIGFLSPGPVRAVSSTYMQLEALIQQVNDEMDEDNQVFVDFAYYPAKEDIPLYDKYGLPYWFGNISKAPASDYDLIMISNSVLLEFVNIFHALPKSGVKPWHRDRLADDESKPFVMMGGIPVADHDAANGEGGLADVIYVGFAEGNFQLMLKDMVENNDNRPVRDFQKVWIRRLTENYNNIYYPDGYDVTYNGASIEAIRPKYPWVPEKVEFHHEHSLEEFPSFEKKVFNPDNSNADGADILISHGCSGAGQCFFCIEGVSCGGWREKSLERIKDALDISIRTTAANKVGYYYTLQTL